MNLSNGEGAVEAQIKKLVEAKYPGMIYDLFVQVTPDHGEDFARVEVDLPGGEEVFMIVRGKFEDEDAAYAELLKQLTRALSAPSPGPALLEVRSLGLHEEEEGA